METILFDSGVRSYRLGAGILKFNPSDPNVYARFLASLDSLAALESELKTSDADPVTALYEADKKVKAILSEVFGPENDMDAIFSGISLLAVGENGRRLLTNFLSAMEPILHEGIRRCAEAEAAR